MRQTGSWAIAFVACLLLSVPAGAADLAGIWIAPAPYSYYPNVEVSGYPNSDAYTERLVFAREHGVLTGKFLSITGEQPLSDLSVEGQTVRFAAGSSRFQGEVHGNELRLQANWGGSPTPIPYTCRKATARDLKIVAAGPTYSFKKIPLPTLRHVSGGDLAPVPPMGVGNFAMASDAKVRQMANEMVADGLRDAGYVYIQIDEGWQGRRDAEGNIHPNSKFPDMKALADYVHSKGLKLGIYSSPGPAACWGYAGSYGHEQQDANTFAKWGVDYLKFDWCSASAMYSTQREMQALYQEMGEALRASGRPIAYGLCEYGLFDVSTWGKEVGANLWRTTGDMADRWDSIVSSGFKENGELDHSGPGGWNDPDNLQIGIGGLTTEEYRTQMTLWSMMAAPLFVQEFANDLSKWTPATREIALNREVIGIDQDVLGIQGHRVLQRGEVEIWTKPLAGGAVAVALFNRAEMEQKVSLHLEELHLGNVLSVRDVWHGLELGSLVSGYDGTVPAHGAILLKAVVN